MKIRTYLSFERNYLSMGFVALVENWHDPEQTAHLKLRWSSPISCIRGQFSWQGMQAQSNQYCFFRRSCKTPLSKWFFDLVYPIFSLSSLPFCPLCRNGKRLARSSQKSPRLWKYSWWLGRKPCLRHKTWIKLMSAEFQWCSTLTWGEFVTKNSIYVVPDNRRVTGMVEHGKGWVNGCPNKHRFGAFLFIPAKAKW